MRLEVPANPVLASRARAIADLAGRSDMPARKAALCAAVALDETTTIAAARQLLGLLWQDDVRTAALHVIDQLVRDHLAAQRGEAAQEGTTP
jgi:hypothetical protein